MALRYACFLSYQRGNDLVDRFARELFQALSDELGLLTPLPVWFDTARIDMGDEWSAASVTALASSVCLVPILTPTYFSAERLYCAREFLGMQAVEKVRMSLTGLRDSLIIPVVLRGAERLPPAIRHERQYFDFSDYLAFGPKQFRSRGFARSVVDLSQRIAKLSDTYAGLDQGDVSHFALPSEQDTRDWLSDVERTVRVPPY